MQIGNSTSCGISFSTQSWMEFRHLALRKAYLWHQFLAKFFYSNHSYRLGQKCDPTELAMNSFRDFERSSDTHPVRPLTARPHHLHPRITNWKTLLPSCPFGNAFRRYPDESPLDLRSVRSEKENVPFSGSSLAVHRRPTIPKDSGQRY